MSEFSVGKSSNFIANIPLGLTLVFLFGTQPFATDFYLACLPEIASDFDGQVAHVQWTLTAYILMFGIAQFLLGDMADKFGRRRVLLWGLSAYGLAALTSALTPHLWLLLVSRGVQGAATAGCVIAARATIRDRYSAMESMRIMARCMAGMAVIAVLSPVVGGIVLRLTNWHINLMVVSAYGFVVWSVVYFSFVETYVHAPLEQKASILSFVRHERFSASTLLSAGSYATSMVFLILSPFIFITEYGFSRVAYGFVPAVCSLAFFIGTLLCRALLRRRDIVHVIQIGATFSLLGALGHILLWWSGLPNPWLLVIPQSLFMLGHGFHQSCGQAGAVAPFPHQAGRAAALSGCIVTTLAFGFAQVATRSSFSHTQTLMWSVVCGACIIAVSAWWMVPHAYQSHPEGTAT